LTLLFFRIDDTCVFALENVSIHGFGGWSYGKTNNDNVFLAGDHEGNYDYLNFSLNISAKPHERLSLFVQPAFNENRDENETALDYAFAEWAFSDALKLRMGKVKAPFMLYTEVYDVGTIRPFFFLPQTVYQELAAEAYKGGGITGSLFKWSWEFMYDLYGGKLELLPKEFFSSQKLEFVSTTPIVNDMLGGRLLAFPPVDGLGFGFSCYSGDTEFESQGNNPESDSLADTYFLFGASIEYRSDPWWGRCEYLMQRESPNVELYVGYAELAYKITEHWQAAIRYEFADVNLGTAETQNSPDSLVEHEEFVMGLNYWFNPNLILKFSYHFVNGNLFAYPNIAEKYMTAMMNGLDESTNLAVFGVQFSF